MLVWKRLHAKPFKETLQEDHGCPVLIKNEAYLAIGVTALPDCRDGMLDHTQRHRATLVGGDDTNFCKATGVNRIS